MRPDANHLHLLGGWHDYQTKQNQADAHRVAQRRAGFTVKRHRLVDGDLLHHSAVASEPLESKSQAPAAEVAASSCLRRAEALAELGLELWE